MLSKFFKGLFDHSRYHHETQDMPAWVRRRIYRDLVVLSEEERHASELLDLPFPPRLCVVDEVRVAMLRPQDREKLNVDSEMRRARKQQKKAREKDKN